MQKNTAFSAILWYPLSMMKKSDSTQKSQPKYDEMNPAELLGIIQKQEAEIFGLKQELNNLISLVRLGNSQKYGKSGDSVPYPEGVEQLSFFNEAEKYGRKKDSEPSFESATAKVPKKPKEKGKSWRESSTASM